MACHLRVSFIGRTMADWDDGWCKAVGDTCLHGLGNPLCYRGLGCWALPYGNVSRGLSFQDKYRNVSRGLSFQELTGTEMAPGSDAVTTLCETLLSVCIWVPGRSVIAAFVFESPLHQLMSESDRWDLLGRAAQHRFCCKNGLNTLQNGRKPVFRTGQSSA